MISLMVISGLAHPVTLTGVKQVPVVDGDKRLAEIIDIAEHSNALQLVHRNPLVVPLIRG